MKILRNLQIVELVGHILNEDISDMIMRFMEFVVRSGSAATMQLKLWDHNERAIFPFTTEYFENNKIPL